MIRDLYDLLRIVRRERCDERKTIGINKFVQTHAVKGSGIFDRGRALCQTHDDRQVHCIDVPFRQQFINYLARQRLNWRFRFRAIINDQMNKCRNTLKSEGYQQRKKKTRKGNKLLMMGVSWILFLMLLSFLPCLWNVFCSVPVDGPMKTKVTSDCLRSDLNDFRDFG